ncbi:hypothetical protein Tco_0982067 [Tanacetum coccineum]
MLVRDPSPTVVEFSAEACDFLVAHPAMFRKFPEPFLCLVRLSHYYDLDRNVYPTLLTSIKEEMDLFAFIYHADPTKVGIGERQIEEGQVPLLDSTVGRVIPLDDQAWSVEDRSEGNDHVGQDEMATTLVDVEVQAAAADKPKGKKKKRRATSGASESDHPPKRLREDHGTSGNVSASTGGKSLAAIQDWSCGSDNCAVYYLPYSSQHSSTNAVDAEAASFVRSFIPPPPVMTAAVTTTVIADVSSAPVLGAGAELATQVHQSIFSDSASIGATRPDIAGPSHPAGTELFADTFYVS